MTSRTSPLIIGVDGGGTACRVALETADGTRLATTHGGAANVTSDPEGALRSITSALEAALAQAGLGMADLQGATAHLGLAGVLSETQAEPLAKSLLFGRVAITDDRPTSVAGALGDSDGAVIAVGTGSFVALQRAGKTRFLGGWGLNLGDEASGAWLGRGLMMRCLRAVDGLISESDLIRDTLARFDTDPAAIVTFARRARPADYAQFAPAVIDAARASDEQGLALMQAGAGYLMNCLRIDLPDPQQAICLIGGIGPHYAPYLAPEIRAALRPAQGSALDGAVLLARRARAGTA